LWFIVDRALAHCDTMDGPIVPEARRSLESGNVTPLLKWVGEQDEQAIQDALERARAVRERGADVREIADQLFLETLVRIHRAGEGEPFTGLKPAGSSPPVFGVADAALNAGSVDALADELSTAIRNEIQKRFDTVLDRQKNVDAGVEAGRAYVEAYVSYMHFVEGIHSFLQHGASNHHFAAGSKHESHDHGR
jgi:hypothetical protein